jgi:hypothetical protein
LAVADILQIEEAIIDRIKGYLAELNATLPPEKQMNADVQELPLDPASIGIPVTATQIYVAFRRETFEAPAKGGVSNPVQPPSQERKIIYELIIRGQALRVRGHQRIYPILNAIRDALTGWMPDDIHRSRGITKPLFPVESGFTNFGEGLWVYSMTFACTSIYSAPIRRA